MSLTDAQLLEWLAGTADPSLRHLVESMLAADASLGPRAAALRRELERQATGGRRLLLPPPGGARWRGAVQTSARAAAVMSGGVAAFEEIDVRVAGLPALAQRRPVLLERQPSGRWTVRHPTTAAAWEQEAPVEWEGEARLFTVQLAREPASELALALPLPTLPVDWSAGPAGRWAALWRGIEEGTVPVVGVRAHGGGRS